MKTNQVNRQKSWTLTLLLATFILATFAGTAASQSDPTDSIPAYTDGEVVVKFISEVVAERVLDTLPGAFVMDRLESSPVFLLGFCCAPIEPYQKAQQLMLQRGVVYAHPNFVVDSSNSVQGSYPFPDDPGGDNKYHGQPAADMLDLDRVHPVTIGNGVRIGVIDGGINFDHPLFDSMSFGGYDFVDDDTLAYDEPGGLVSGHGTFVAGVLHLVAPGAELVPYRVMNAFGQGDGFAMARAIERAVADECRLINISLILTDRHWAVRDAIEFAESHGIAVVAAAGNDSTSVDTYPAAENATIAVAAVDSQYVLADFSNYGNYIDVCAPGVDLYSPYLDTSYAWWSGTSFAAPCVAGQLALLAEIYPRISVDDFHTIISENFKDLYEYNPDYEGMLGYGMINTYTAVLATGVMAIMDGSTPPDPSITISLTPSRIEHTWYLGQCFPVVEQVALQSSNAPAVYYAEAISVINTFTSVPVARSTGITNATVLVGIDATKFNSPGTYVDSIGFWVVGTKSPTILEVELTMIDPSSRLKAESEEVDSPGLRNYPNPFNPSTTIHFSLEKAADVELTVYDVLGRKVTCLHSGGLPAGDHQILWDGTRSGGQQVSSGVYFYRLKMGQQVETKKMMLLK